MISPRGATSGKLELPLCLAGQVVSMTGTPGHKASQRLIEREAYRRVMSGEAPQTLAEFAQQLLDWLQETHPGASPMTLGVVEDRIRETWHRRHEMIRGG